MSKKTIIFLIIIIAVVGVSLLYVFTRQTTDTGENEDFISWLFPSSAKRPTNLQPPETPPSFDDLSNYRDQISLLQITKESISGATFANGKVKYIEKATGHLYESSPNGEEIVPLSNKTVPRVIEVLWSPDADSDNRCEANYFPLHPPFYKNPD